jgi:DNA polymerase phi
MTEQQAQESHCESVLSLFYLLASLDPVERCRAACDLLKQVHNYQRSFLKEQALKPETPPASPPADESDDTKRVWESKCHPEVEYIVKRLIKGLPSSRDGARQGFSIALTEVFIH